MTKLRLSFVHSSPDLTTPFVTVGDLGSRYLEDFLYAIILSFTPEKRDLINFQAYDELQIFVNNILS